MACTTSVKENTPATDTSPGVGNAATDKQAKGKDSIINNLLQSFNEIQDNLNEIKQKENILTLNVQSPELQRSQREQIKTDIASIYDLLNKNRQALVKMNEKLRDSSFKINQLQKFIGNLFTQVTDKEFEVNSLKNQLSGLKIELDTLHMHTLDVQHESARKSGLLSRGYFAIGTFEELKKEGVIVEKGGLIGIGKVTELNPDLNPGFFSIVDKNEKKDISVAAKYVKLIGPHPSDSYTMDDKRQSIKTISIKDPKKFWSTSDYVIVVISGEKPIQNEFFAGGSPSNRYQP